MNNYQEALELVKNSKRGLLFLHISPDEDSVASNLAFKKVAESLSACQIDIVSEDAVKEELDYLPSVGKIKKTDMEKVDFSQYDLFILLDISDLTRLSRSPRVKLPEGAKILNIDHHETNTQFGVVNIVEPNIGSTAELLYRVFCDWGVDPNPELATLLLLGIVADTGSFRYTLAVSPETFRIAGQLLEAGADYKNIAFNSYKNVPLGTFKLWSFIFDCLQVVSVGKISYVWSGVGFEDYHRLEASEFESPTSLFFGSVKGTDFGLMLFEEDRGLIKGSLRSRTDFDVAKIAQEFGGGGHKAAAGFRYPTETSFAEGVKKILGIVKNALEKM